MVLRIYAPEDWEWVELDLTGLWVRCIEKALDDQDGDAYP